MNCKPIAIVKSPVKEGIDRDWGKIKSEIHIYEEFAGGLTGIESFSHIIVIFEMHRSSWTPEADLVRRPQGLEDMPLIGIFAQRAKHRPNPVGVTSVRLLGVDRNILRVQGLDAIDDTPVLDIKPYFPHFDMVFDAHNPEWVDKIMKDYF
ncbi:tRNA (N6-threonylcarbamoyladenosine(37)-N6)-methyltransferase TrmO [Chloroflexota bacterium]